MEGSGLEWENLALYSRRPIQLPFSMSCSSPITSSALLGTCPSSKFPAPSFDGYGNIGCSSDLMNLGSTPELSLGQQQEYSRNLLSSSIPVSSTPTKRSRASYHNMQNPCCQVEGCNLDLKLAKDYHRRHRICETHSKSPKVIVAGMERRFCQQCSRFHDLSEFDDKKRSCRRRLSDHNARRRRVQPESVQLSSAGLTPSIYDQRRQNVLLNGLPVSLPNSRWENAHSSMSRQAHIRPSKPRAMEGTLTFSNDDVHMDPVIHRSNPHILDQCLHVASTNSFMAPADLVSAHSLLSTSTWTMSERECAVAMEHGNYSPVMRHSESDSHYLKLFHNNNIGLNEGPSIPVHDAGPSHHQEYQLFKDPCDSATFYSAQRTL